MRNQSFEREQIKKLEPAFGSKTFYPRSQELGIQVLDVS